MLDGQARTWWSTSATASRSRRTARTWSSFRGTRRTWPRIVKLCNRAGVPFLPRGAGTSLAGGCLPVGGGVMIVLTRMKRDPGDQPPRPLRRRRAGRRQRLADQRPEGDRLSLRARSVEPGGLHDRRQRGDQLRRAAHAQVRRHGQPRARASRRCWPTAASCRSAGRPKIPSGSTWPARSSAAKGRWRSSPRSGCG